MEHFGKLSMLRGVTMDQNSCRCKQARLVTYRSRNAMKTLEIKTFNINQPGNVYVTDIKMHKQEGSAKAW